MTNRPIEYIPPSHEVLEHFTHDVCRGLGDDYADPEIRLGFTNFMRVITRVYANHLNQKHTDELDMGIE